MFCFSSGLKLFDRLIYRIVRFELGGLPSAMYNCHALNELHGRLVVSTSPDSPLDCRTMDQKMVYHTKADLVLS